MRKVPVLAQFTILGMLAVAIAPWAGAESVTVNASDDIYAAGNQSALVTSSAIGTLPGDISATGVNSFTFSTTGIITINLDGGPFTVYNDADGQGTGVAATSTNSGYGSISGITAPGQGYLVGVFVGASGPSGAAPASLDFATTSFSSLSPLVDQVFFIGDGLTGDGTGTLQSFYVPTGATELYLGISDACFYGDYNSGSCSDAPGYYYDNVGTFGVTATPHSGAGPQNLTGSPEPSSLVLFGTGILAMAGMLRRKLLTK